LTLLWTAATTFDALTRILALSFVMLTTARCVAVQSTANLIDADIQLEAARTAGAEKYAPYPYTSAKLYLHEARREAGYSNYDTAVEYAAKASKLANDARNASVNRTKSDGTPESP
jgi:hypothetical protein